MRVLGDKLYIVAYYIYTHLVCVHMYILALYINEVRGEFRLVSSLISHERLGAVIRFQCFLPGRRASPALQGYTLGLAWQAYRWFPGAVQEIEGVSATGRRRGRWREVRASLQSFFGRIFSFNVGCLSSLRGHPVSAWVSQEVRLGPKGAWKLYPYVVFSVCLMVYGGVILSSRLMSQMLWCRVWNRWPTATSRLPDQDDLVIFWSGITLLRVKTRFV